MKESLIKQKLNVMSAQEENELDWNEILKNFKKSL